MATRRVIADTPSLLERPELRTARLATVAPIAPIDRLYTYVVPDEWHDSLKPGMRVRVPFGRKDRPAEAFCIEVSEGDWSSSLKPLLSIEDEEPLLSEKLLALGRWIARYYACPLGRTLDMMVPAVAKAGVGARRVRYVSVVSPRPADDSLTVKQRAALAALDAAGQPLKVDALRAAAQCGPGVLRALTESGYIRIEVRQEYTSEPTGAPPLARHDPTFELNPDQQTAIDELNAAIDVAEFGVHVLFGVTGSGKTECYVRAMRRALERGRQAILLVPEIALTTQTVQRLQSRFDRVAVIHSGLTGGQRARTWASVASGETPIVIGTRSAVFAPCPNLGVIIVDEEQESSYKSQAAPRYHTRDAAITRGHIEGIPVALGSATPSLETWHNLQRRRHYHLIRLPHRVRNLPMPTMHLVDMRQEHRERRGIHLLSRAMEQQLHGVLQLGQQSVLLLNRRGYASYLICPMCNTPIVCPHCSVNMVFHRTDELAHCHYCLTKLPVPNKCQMAGCDGTLVKFGIGVQRVEQELTQKFPSARIRRIDSDNMQRTADYAEILTSFEKREFDILVGTQMIAKGLDFPFVSFVGVVSADTALSINDFRAEERTFQLVLQVAGRSGRGDQPGHVVVQTFSADRDPIQHAVRGDYEGFAELELSRRRQVRLPPITRMARIILSDARLSRVTRAGADLAQRIEDAFIRHGIRAMIYPPQPAPIARLRDQYRFELLFTVDSAAGFLSALDLLRADDLLKAACRSLVIDVDPVSLQ